MSYHYHPTQLDKTELLALLGQNSELEDLCHHALDTQAELTGLGERIFDLRCELNNLETRFRTLQLRKTELETEIIERKGQVKKVKSGKKPSTRSTKYKTQEERIIEKLKGYTEEQKAQLEKMLK